MLLMIDNYDSFTYNLVQYFGELGAQVKVFRNDEITLGKWRLGHGQLLPARAFQRFPVEMHGARIGRIEGLGRQRIVAFLEARIIKAHVLGQQAEDFRIRLRFAQRRHGRIVRHHV